LVRICSKKKKKEKKEKEENLLLSIRIKVKEHGIPIGIQTLQLSKRDFSLDIIMLQTYSPWRYIVLYCLSITKSINIIRTARCLD
jgi:hypothetical protein